jgi:hypothetical protein
VYDGGMGGKVTLWIAARFLSATTTTSAESRSQKSNARKCLRRAISKVVKVRDNGNHVKTNMPGFVPALSEFVEARAEMADGWGGRIGLRINKRR